MTGSFRDQLVFRGQREGAGRPRRRGRSDVAADDRSSAAEGTQLRLLMGSYPFIFGRNFYNNLKKKRRVEPQSTSIMKRIPWVTLSFGLSRGDAFAVTRSVPVSPGRPRRGFALLLAVRHTEAGPAGVLRRGALSLLALATTRSCTDCGSW